MTALLDTPTAVAAIAEMLKDQARFDATRPPCPSYCAEHQHDGDSIAHYGQAVTLPCTPEICTSEPATVGVLPRRHDALDMPPEEEVEVCTGYAQSAIGDSFTLTAQQAYDLGAALIAAARELSADLTIPAPDVKIGDRINVRGEWLHVYAVLADEPSNNVQISVTADPGGWSDLENRDENPEHFTPADKVRVRRAAPTGGTR